MPRKRWFNRQTAPDYTSFQAAEELHAYITWYLELDDEQDKALREFIARYGKERYEAGFLVGGRQYHALS